MAEIADLLEKLKQLDEPTYEKIARGIPLQPCGQYMVFDHGEVRACQYHEAYMPFGDLLREVAEAWLQFCIQRAISAREWAFQIAYYPPEGPKKWSYRAYIWPGIVMKCSEEELPASALLACYIACLESHPC